MDQGVPDGDALLKLIGDSHFVLIGEGSHGTHEFYAARADMTRWLIEKMGFCGVAVEADWPDAYRVNRYVRAPQRRSHGRRVAARLRALSHLDVAQRRGARLRRVAA